MQFAKHTDKSSISREDARTIGLLVESEKLRTNYRYDIEKFITDCKSRFVRE